jgi:hypothetical protein
MAEASAAAVGREGQAAHPVALWTPQPGPQANAIAADWCPIMFYGGGKFSGKSDFLLGDYLQDLETYREHWQGIIFRRALTEFTELKLRANELFPKIGGKWQEQKSQWVFPQFGTKDQIPTLRFRYLENLRDIRLYEGHSYPWIGVDELGDWEDPDAFFRLITCNRYGRHPIPNKRIRATGNPGGRGHLWIKEFFVDPAPKGSHLLYDEVLKKNYMFILGTYRDNQEGMRNDPDYANNLNRAGSPALVKALKEGDFSVVAGAFFEFDHRHIIQPFKIPRHWKRFMSMDWGACGEGDPFSIGWWAVSDGTNENGEIPYFKRGTMIRYREWYGKGLKRVAVKEVADGIKELEKNDPPEIERLAGGDIKKKLDESGPSIFEMFADNEIYFQRADMGRTAGWLKMREYLKGDDGTPKVYCMANCHHSIKIVPTIQYNPKDANDIEEVNDDLVDEWRYALMGRVYANDKAPKAKSLAEQFKTPTIDEAWKLKEQQAKQGRSMRR